MILRNCVLLVESNRENVRAVFEAFRGLREPSAVHAVSTAAEAISYLMGIGKYSHREEFPVPTLVLIGLEDPASEHFAVVHWVRSRPELKPLRIVALAESSDEQLVAQAYDAGVNSFLLKPKDPAASRELLELLARYWTQWNQVPTTGNPKIYRPVH